MSATSISFTRTSNPVRVLPDKTLGILLLVWFSVWTLAAAALPALPIDETRYLTVAWEMGLRHQWILPTLNFEPYSHKPPLLFWLINAVWAITGPSVWGARIVPFAVSALLLCGTFAFARRLFPDRPRMPVFAAIVLASSPFFYLYGSLIMFDMLNGLIALSAAAMVWKAAQTQKYRWLLAWGAFVGFGVLAKGPVILVYTIFLVLLAPLWKRPDSLPRWYGMMLAGILTAAAIGLSWAVPAALMGGPEYSNMIFWKQSAGRMTHSFAHKRSFLFYLPFLPLMFLPLTVWPAWWRAMKAQTRGLLETGAGKFLSCVVLPPLICFLLISGKQVHYLAPLLPGMAIFFAAALERHMPERISLKLPFTVFGAALMLTLAACFIAPHLGFVQKDEFMRTLAGSLNPYLAGGALLLSAAIYYLLQRTEGAGRLLFLPLMMALFFAHFIGQAEQRTFEYYDLAPIAAALQNHKDRPLAFVRNYEGELGFTARLEKPLVSLTSLEQLPGWFDRNPGGAAVVRFKDDHELGGYRILARMPYRSPTKSLALVEKEP